MPIGNTHYPEVIRRSLDGDGIFSADLEVRLRVRGAVSLMRQGLSVCVANA